MNETVNIVWWFVQRIFRVYAIQPPENLTGYVVRPLEQSSMHHYALGGERG